MLGLRATVEGFYGRPWSHAERLEHLGFSGRVGLDTYVYGPKDDPWHRERWREPYPSGELGRLAELVTAAGRHGVEFVFAIHPGLSMDCDDPAEQQALHDKAGQLYDVGVRRFSLFFDDIELGDDPGAAGAAHGRVCARFVSGFLAPRGAPPTADEPFLMVPTDYAGIEESPYRTGLAKELPEHSVVFWTGRDIVVGEVSDADVEAARAAFGRPLALWDNFPVNDFEPTRLFLGPLVDRPTRYAPDTLVGITANPMVQPRASRIALTTVAEYARDPAGYDSAAAHERAITDLVPAELRPLVEACSSWPPSADPSVALSVEGLLPLAAMPDDLDDDLARELRPWVLAGRDMARAGIAAAELLAGRGDVEATRTALEVAESHEANVLRTVVPPFVHAVLGRS